MSTDEALQRQLSEFRADYGALRECLAGAVVGQDEMIDDVLTAMLAGGHVLIEGPPGLGKTMLARALAGALELSFRRIQFTPDIMPADVIGTYVVMESHGRRSFEFQQGPIFANLVLADEINRATPKTQSALLEALSEGAVTVANETYDLPRPFFVVATQSSANDEGVFPLPALQRDRFLFNTRVTFPDDERLDAILQRMTGPGEKAGEVVLSGQRILEMSQLARRVPIAPDARRFALKVLTATHPRHESAPEFTRRHVEQGASPRAAQSMLLAGQVRALVEGRVNVARDDLAKAALPALRHRLTLSFEADAEGVDADAVIGEILKHVS